MGAESLVPLIISAIGAGASAYENKRVQDRNEEISNNMVRNQQKRQHEVDARLDQNLNELQKSDGEKERQASLEGFLGQLRANAGNAGGTTGTAAASSRFMADNAAAKAGIQNYGTNRADIMAKILAPALQRVRENAMTNRAQDDIRGISRNAQGDAWLAQLRMQRNVASPWIGAAGEVAQNVSGAMVDSYGRVTDSDRIGARLNGTINNGYVPPKIDLGSKIWGSS